MKTILIYPLAALIAISASVSHAADYAVERTLPIASSPDEAWNMIGDFCDIDDWHPAITNCRLSVIDGALHRILTTADGAELVEKRIAAEPGLSYTYSIVSSPLPIEKYTATFSITRGKNSAITWSGRFSSEDPGIEATITEIYESGLSAIEARLSE